MPKRRKGRRELPERREPERFPRRPETVEERWRRLYSELTRFRQNFAPAYNEAVAPLIAGVIDYLRKPHVRVLVLAGGTGVFSKNLLQAVKQELKRLNNNAAIEVFETDIVEAIAKAPVTAHRIRVDIHKLPFRNESFDLIVGQSMIHQGRMQESIREIKRVVKPDGSFVHIQDTIPDPSRFLPGWGKRPVLRPETQFERVMIRGVGIETHNALVNMIRQNARANDLNSAALGVRGEALVKRTYRFGKIAGKDLDAGNAVYYHMGEVSVVNEQKIPSNKKKLSYTGLATIISKGLVRPVVEHLQKHLK